jgi:hypothetical protein
MMCHHALHVAPACMGHAPPIILQRHDGSVLNSFSKPEDRASARRTRGCGGARYDGGGVSVPSEQQEGLGAVQCGEQYVAGCGGRCIALAQATLH